MDDRLMRLIRQKCGLGGLSPADAALVRRASEVAKIRLSEEGEIEQAFKASGRNTAAGSTNSI
jgi:hypothetical protein